MSSIRLFILWSFAEHGPMHGHRLRLEAERNLVHLWTDISVGAVYGAMKRLAADGLLSESGREREGNRPTRQVYEITDKGRCALAELRRDGLSELWFKFDPFDLALTRTDPDTLELLPGVLSERLENVQAKLEETSRVIDTAREYVGLAKLWALKHNIYRLQAEVRYLNDLISVVGDIISDEHNPSPKKAKPQASHSG
jgi:DNA-binding PadR family transcriptional regulator